MMPMLLLAWLLGASADRADLPTGQIIADVRCEADASQGYALYLPSGYSGTRAWPVILAFDPGGRGLNAVQRYQAAAERYGYIVAASNNSRNGSPDTAKAVASMSADVGSRFRVDPTRVYTAGMSGGARVALAVALGSPQIAGVIASSAGYPDDTRRKTLPFPLFATAGTEDFNHLEMRELDRALTSPHRLAIFEGGHVWLSSALAIEAVEWMELQAMRTGLAPRDQQEIDELFVRRLAATDAAGLPDAQRFQRLEALIADFQGLKDVTALVSRAAALGRSADVRARLKRDRDEDDRERRLLNEVFEVEHRLTSRETRANALEDLRDRWKRLFQMATRPDDSADRRLGRRVLSTLGMNMPPGDTEYARIVAEYRLGRR